MHYWKKRKKMFKNKDEIFIKAKQKLTAQLILEKAKAKTPH